MKKGFLILTMFFLACSDNDANKQGAMYDELYKNTHEVRHVDTARISIDTIMVTVWRLKGDSMKTFVEIPE